jgi:superfamily II DNA or RNA helicase
MPNPYERLTTLASKPAAAKKTFQAYYNGAVASLKLPPDLEAPLKRVLTFTDRNKLYEQKQRPWATVNDVEKCLYNNGLMPTGLLPRAINAMNSWGVDVNPICLIKDAPTIVTPTYPDWLRSYQKDAINMALLQPRCLLEMPPAAGKTITAGFYLLNFPTSYILFTVPTIALAYQTKESFTKLNIFNEEIGLVGDQVKNWQRITIGVINSLELEANNDSEYLKRIQVTVHDEVHGSSNRYLKVTKSLVNQYYCLGMTGTAWRNDGGDIQMEGVCGPISLKISELEVKRAGGKVQPCYIQLAAPNRYTQEKKVELILPKNPSTVQINKAYTYCVTENPFRNKLISDLTKFLLEFPKRKGGILILVHFIKHGEILQKTLFKDAGITATFLHGSSKGNREDTIKEFNQGNIEVLIASSILNMGVDIPNLEYLILAGANSNKTTHVQQVNRALRNTSEYSKLHGYVIDISDSDMFFKKRASKRASYTTERYTGTDIISVATITELKELLNGK